MARKIGARESGALEAGDEHFKKEGMTHCVRCCHGDLELTTRYGSSCLGAWARESMGKEELEVMTVGSSQDQFFEKRTRRAR